MSVSEAEGKELVAREGPLEEAVRSELAGPWEELRISVDRGNRHEDRGTGRKGITAKRYGLISDGSRRLDGRRKQTQDLVAGGVQERCVSPVDSRDGIIAVQLGAKPLDHSGMSSKDIHSAGESDGSRLVPRNKKGC